MIKEFNIEVPTTLSGISLSTYQSWMKILYKYQESNMDDDNYLKIKMLQTFCNLSIEDTHKIPLHSFDNVINHINNLFANESETFKDTFIFKDSKDIEIEFGFIPKLDDMTFGEYVDLDKYINDVSTWNKAMAVLFRPKTNIINNKYKVEDYKGSSKWSEYMLEAPVDVVLGAMAFIGRLQNQLLKHTLHSSKQQVKGGLEVASKQISEESTDGFNQFTLWLKKMQLKSMMQ